MGLQTSCSDSALGWLSQSQMGSLCSNGEVHRLGLSSAACRLFRARILGQGAASSPLTRMLCNHWLGTQRNASAGQVSVRRQRRKRVSPFTRSGPPCSKLRTGRRERPFWEPRSLPIRWAVGAFRKAVQKLADLTTSHVEFPVAPCCGRITNN